MLVLKFDVVDYRSPLSNGLANNIAPGLQAEDLDQQHGSRGPKRDNQSRHYTAENVEVIVVIRLTAAVGLRLRSIHGGLLRNGGGLDWLYLLYARQSSANCSWVRLSGFGRRPNTST